MLLSRNLIEPNSTTEYVENSKLEIPNTTVVKSEGGGGLSTLHRFKYVLFRGYYVIMYLYSIECMSNIIIISYCVFFMRQYFIIIVIVIINCDNCLKPILFRE